MRLIRVLAVFAAGLVVGTLVTRPSSAQNENTGLRLNHVGIAVKDYQQSMDYYTKVMGFRVAFALKGPDGKPGTTYLQINRDTFLELAQASGKVVPGTITHIGIQTENADATVARLRELGAKVTDARVSANSGSKLANVTDPDGIRMELNELIPGSLTRKAVESWK